MQKQSQNLMRKINSKLSALALAASMAWVSTLPFAQQARAQSISVEEDAVGGKIPEVRLTNQIMFQILAAEVAAQRGQTLLAARTYFDLARETRDPRLAQRATELALAARSLERALPAAQLWFELAPDSPAAAQAMESLWLSSGKLSDAEPMLAKRLVQARKDKTVAQTYQQLLRMLPGLSDKAAALAMFERISKDDQQVPEARLALGTVALQAGRPEKAVQEARAAVKLAPNREEIVVSAARVMADAPKGADEAIGLLEELLKRPTKALEGHFVLGRLYLEKEQVGKAQQTFEAALKQEPQNPSLLLALSQVASQAKQPKVAENYLERFVDLPANVRRDNNLAYTYLGQIAEEAKDWAKARTWYSKVQEGELYLGAKTREAVAMGYQGQVDEARALLKSLPATGNREHIQITSAEASVLRNAKRHQEVFQVLDEAVQRTRNTPEFLYEHALAAEKIGKVDVMEQSLRRLIELRPDAAHAYNALGYSFADRNLRLSEALDLLIKADQLKPNDPHIVDSLGWVYYRMGELEKARSFLERALAMQRETDVLVHLGEVLWVQGKRDEAIKHLRDAQAREADNEVLVETLQRLKVPLSR